LSTISGKYNCQAVNKKIDTKVQKRKRKREELVVEDEK
jgi:hypothetical protein